MYPFVVSRVDTWRSVRSPRACGSGLRTTAPGKKTWAPCTARPTTASSSSIRWFRQTKPSASGDALDRDVERAGGGVHVLLTVFWHVRSTAEVAERYRARTWVPATARAPRSTRRGVPVTDPFRPGDALPGGIEAFATARSNEVVYWIPHTARSSRETCCSAPTAAASACARARGYPRRRASTTSRARCDRCSTSRSSGSSSRTASPCSEDGREALAAALDAP